jgi:DUF1680 family protein
VPYQPSTRSGGRGACQLASRVAEVRWFAMDALAQRLAVIAYGPNELRTAVEGTALTVQTLTEYPFNDRVELIISTG